MKKKDRNIYIVVLVVIVVSFIVIGVLRCVPLEKPMHLDGIRDSGVTPITSTQETDKTSDTKEGY